MITKLLTPFLVCAMALTALADPNDRSPWGLASGSEWAKEYPRFNPMLRDAGFTWLRIFEEWGWIQPKPGEWKWEQMDAKLADAKRNGLRMSGGLWYFAPWATVDGGTRTAPLKDINAWSEYVSAAVSRYKGDITHWEVWNEYNGSFGKSASGDKVRDYTDLFVAASKAAKAADPNAKVGLNCANFSVGFFDAVIKAGAAGHFDFICIHPYENVGMAMAGEEPAYLSMVASLRKMLADNKQPVDTPIWITEAGVLVSIDPDRESDQLQAEGLVKLYVLSMAQGIERVFWFEARGPSYGKGVDHGLIRKDWSIRPAYAAMQNMTKLLGPEPKYVGWMNDGGVYGFVFENAGKAVLSTWAPPGEAKVVTMPAGARITTTTGDAVSMESAVPVSKSPLWVTDLPADLVERARANGKKPFPWGGDYASAEVVSCRLSATNIDKGIKQINPKTTAVEHGLAESYRRSDIHNEKLNNEGRYAYFRVDSAFAGFGTKDLEITVVAKNFKPGKQAAISMTYESLKGYKAAPGGTWTIPAGDEWQEHTWIVNDANFVGGWGWNFRTDAAGSAHDLLLKEVRVRKVSK